MLTNITSVDKYDWAALHELVQDTNPALVAKINQCSLQTAQRADAFHQNYYYIGMNKINPTSNRFLNLMIFSFGLKFPSQTSEGSTSDHWELPDQWFKVLVHWSAFYQESEKPGNKNGRWVTAFFTLLVIITEKKSAHKVITITLIIAQWCSLKIIKCLDMV